MLKRLLTILVIILVIAVAAGEIILPKLASDAVAQGMRDLTGTTQVRASVDKNPAIAMLGGSFSTVNIEADNAKLDKITFANLTAVLSDVQLDRQRLFFNRTLSIERVKDVNLTATITQEELARYINQNVKGIKNAIVTITPGKMQATSSFTFGAIATVAVSLEGKIVSDGQKIKFVTDRFFLNNTPVGNIGGAMLAEIPLLELKKLPFGVTVREITMADGKVIIATDNKPR